MGRIVKLLRPLLLAAGVALMFGATAEAQQAPARPAAPGTAQAKPDPADETRGGWRGACRRDVTQFCRAAVGGRAKRQCLDVNLTKVSAPCQAALGERRRQRAEARQTCRADTEKLCKDVVGGSAKLQCLRQKAAEVGPDCAKALAGLAAGSSGKRKSEPAPAPKN